MARRPTRFERDLADLHGDGVIEMIDVTPRAKEKTSYRAFVREPDFIKTMPPFVRGSFFVIAFTVLSAVLVLAGIALLGALATIALGLKLIFGG